MLILASQSPRRSHLLSKVGYSFVTKPADIDESRLDDETPQEYVRRLAALKALSVSKDMGNAVVLGADTTVAIDGECLGKPATREEAAAMLNSLSGREHYVYTGWAVVQNGVLKHNAVETTVVRFRKLSTGEISAYIDSKEPYDKAGSYAIQEEGGVFVDSLEGSYSNVIGLPLSQVIRALDETGVERL